MTLALVQAMVAILLTMVATWTGLLVSVAFLVPRATTKSEQLITALLTHRTVALAASVVGICEATAWRLMGGGKDSFQKPTLKRA